LGKISSLKRFNIRSATLCGWKLKLFVEVDMLIQEAKKHEIGMAVYPIVAKCGCNGHGCHRCSGKGIIFTNLFIEVTIN
jgi:hypothetical protein